MFYQIPQNAKKLPLVFWHGIGQFSKTWETTPDGRDGFQNIFLRRNFGVYLLDQPRRGNAGRGTVEGTIVPTPDEQPWFGTFRVGVWPDYFPGVQFSKAQETLNQYFRSMTPNIGPIDINVNVDTVDALFKKIGSAIFVTHKQHENGEKVSSIFFIFDFFNRIHLIKSETDRQSVFILLTPQRTNQFSGLCFLPDIWPLKTLQHKIDIAGLEQLAEAAFGDLVKGIA